MHAEPPEFLRTTRSSYDAIADDYADRFGDGLAGLPLERSLLTAFAELARTPGRAAAGGAPPPVADLGCGPGHVTALVHRLGLPVFGVDLSPRMVSLAREAHPELRFHVGSMTALDLPAGTLGGIVALDSITHVPDDHLADVLAEFHRVLMPGAPVLLAFESGDEDGGLHLDERFGRPVSLDYHWRSPSTVVAHLTKAGLELTAQVLREPTGDEKRPHALLLARRPKTARA
ncbi:class I SAM-dependent DNA methyltransferase [Streptomyces incanus]|uniref:Class I SAM-dependent DNA methyltransferase n=1 Tax=Streptomyces incanus TaxID=887453 RepID=A0ABW0XTX7_9ACTN